MTCKKKHPPVEGTRAAIAALFERGKVGAAAHHRLALCKDIGDCGQLCPWLAKVEGEPPSCIELSTRKVVHDNLYEAVRRPEKRCPLEVW